MLVRLLLSPRIAGDATCRSVHSLEFHTRRSQITAYPPKPAECSIVATVNTMSAFHRRHKLSLSAGSIFLVAAAWIGATLIRPHSGHAQTAEVSAFLFPQVTLSAGQWARICGTQFGDVTASGVAGLL